MDYEAVRAGLQQAIPFNVHVGLEVAEVGPGRGVVTLPDRAETRNHVGSQHAGALFSAGEAASGAAFVGTFAERMATMTPLAERADIAYRKLARGPITATGTLGGDAEALLRDLDAEGRVRFPIQVELADAEGTVVAEMTVEWYVRAKTAA
jgi:acyl-coenzyme A thioesterase PaaI-like protein